MADKNQKTHAERAASAAQGKKVKTENSKSSGSKASNAKKEPARQEQAVSQIPVRLITSVVFLGCGVLFSVILFACEGAVLTLIERLIHGLIGRVGFIISIPVLLYLFWIHAFSGKRPVTMRTICLAVFVLICGCISHLNDVPEVLPKGMVLLKNLFANGLSGRNGGVICGLLACFIKLLFGSIISYILLVSTAIITLLGGMGITIPGLVRAYRERPRAEWEEEVFEEPEEPATAVVNHIANKRIEYLEQRRQREAEKAAQAEAEAKRQEKDKKPLSKAEDIISQIDADVEEPVAVSGGTSAQNDDEDVDLIPVVEKTAPVEQDTPEEMPPLRFEPREEPASEVLSDTPAAEEAVFVKPVSEQTPAQAKRERESSKRSKVTARDAQDSATAVAEEIAQAETMVKAEYCFPPIDLLKLPANGSADGTAEMRENTRRLNETLASFKIDAHISNVTRGPSVTRYEVELAKGVRLSKITSAADDIALSLGAPGVRIAAVPDRISLVGIEVPNRMVTTVSLREVIDSKEFHSAKSKSSFAVGKDIGGTCIVGNISRLPHMLIAGTTGSGKSVCMNSIIISLLYKASPDDVKLIMVDPKMVELGIYNGIPHLLIPVVTDPKKAAGSLQWAVTEMMRRYKAMSDAGVRDLESYNSIVESQEENGKRLPQVVVIIDELADLMLVAAKEVEESICRIAQMGRAAGIHLIIATQRPSADVITGLMKANIPSRIAFSVASAMESRIILDTQGAEKLVGKGDMLYAPIGCGKPKRVQGCFVTDGEVEAVANYVKSHFITEYDQDVMEEIERKAVQTGNAKTSHEPESTVDELYQDEMLPAAVEVILETKQASVSMLQRRLKLGYARAARIVDEMEELGIVGPYQGSKPRDILVTAEQWDAMRSGSPAQMEFDDLEMEDGPVAEDY